jgi:hypothetical protein
MSTLNLDQYTRHLPAEAKGNLRPGAPTVGCKDCLLHATGSAYENWADDKGREATETEEHDEVDRWAKMYVSEGMSSPCSSCQDAHEVIHHNEKAERGW